MYDTMLMSILGFACGAAVSLFALVALWSRRQEAAQTPYQRSLNYDFWGKATLVSAMASVSALVIAVAFAAGSTVGLPHPEWTVSACVGVALPVALRRLMGRGRRTEQVRRQSARRKTTRQAR